MDQQLADQQALRGQLAVIEASHSREVAALQSELDGYRSDTAKPCPTDPTLPPAAVGNGQGSVAAEAEGPASQPAPATEAQTPESKAVCRRAEEDTVMALNGQQAQARVRHTAQALMGALQQIRSDHQSLRERVTCYRDAQAERMTAAGVALSTRIGTLAQSVRTAEGAFVAEIQQLQQRCGDLQGADRAQQQEIARLQEVVNALQQKEELVKLSSCSLEQPLADVVSASADQAEQHSETIQKLQVCGTGR